MVATAASRTPPSAPFQPAWAAATIRAFGIGEQDRCTIRRQRRDGDSRRRGDEGVRLWHGVERPGLGDHDRIGAMVLMRGQQMRRDDAEVGRNATPVLRDGGPVVLRAGPAVQRRIDPFRHAAAAGEETVREAVMPRQLR